MKRSRSYIIIIIILFLTNLTYGQSGYLVDKDYRIAKYEDSIISFLIKKQQFDINNRQFKTSDYEGKIYVRKCLEIYSDSSNNILLVQFGSLADHVDVHWGVFTAKQCFFFYKTDDLEFQRFQKQNTTKTTAVIATYIKQTPP